MSINSMTGFARGDGSDADVRWHWEVRSVNGRGLDVRTRLAPGYDGLDAAVREAASRRLTRGSVTIALAVERTRGATAIRINEAGLADVMAALERLTATGSFERPRPEGILALRGVLEVAETQDSAEVVAARGAAMLATLAATLDDLARARAGEGARLAQIVADQVAGVERIVALVAAAPARKPEAIRARIGEQVARILGSGVALDEARLYQEAALVATRADVEEELKRLQAHVAAARDLIAANEPVGRKFDFLAQEFNREANTLCSKSGDVEITRMGLDLKAIIDQMREQVQNIE